MICIIICIDGFLCMSHLDIVHMLSAYVPVIHTLSGRMCIMHTLFVVVLDKFLPNRQCQCHPYVISSTLYISYHVQLSFCTLSTHKHIVNVICILSTDAYVMYIWYLLLLSTYVHVICILSGHMCTIHTLPTVVLDMFFPKRQCQCHPYIISTTLYISYHVQLSFCTLYTQMYIVHVVCMLSAHVHIICFSSLTLLVYPIIHNLVSAHCLHTCIL